MTDFGSMTVCKLIGAFVLYLFVPLTLKTPYSTRQLIDCILQAKACVYFGEDVKDLR